MDIDQFFNREQGSKEESDVKQVSEFIKKVQLIFLITKVDRKLKSYIPTFQKLMKTVCLSEILKKNVQKLFATYFSPSADVLIVRRQCEEEYALNFLTIFKMNDQKKLPG